MSEAAIGLWVEIRETTKDGAALFIISLGTNFDSVKVTEKWTPVGALQVATRMSRLLGYIPIKAGSVQTLFKDVTVTLTPSLENKAALDGLGVSW